MLFEDYKNLHQIPEIGFREYKTSAYILKRIIYSKAKIHRIKTGICAFFDFKKEKTIAFRAELDALKIHEKNDISFISKNLGYMHACGHDGHMSILLSLIDYVNNLNDYPYNILFIFQPSEEIIGGSISMIPYLKNYLYEAFFGMHFFPLLKEKEIFTGDNIVFASSTEVNIKIKTESIHIANYKKNNDAIHKGNLLIKKLEKEANKQGLLLHFGYFNAGKSRNVTASKCLIKGSLRGFDNNKISKFINTHLQSDKNCKIKLSETIPVLKNKYQNHDLIKRLNINYISKPYYQAEDFSFYSNEFPTMFFLQGINSSPLHSANFILKEEDLKIGYEFYINVLNYFQTNIH